MLFSECMRYDYLWNPTKYPKALAVPFRPGKPPNRINTSQSCKEWSAYLVVVLSTHTVAAGSICPTALPFLGWNVSGPSAATTPQIPVKAMDIKHKIMYYGPLWVSFFRIVSLIWGCCPDRSTCFCLVLNIRYDGIIILEIIPLLILYIFIRSKWNVLYCIILVIFDPLGQN